MYLIEFLGLPKRVPVVLKTTEARGNSLDEVLYEAIVVMDQAVLQIPEIAGYRICRKGQDTLLTRWKTNS